LIFVSVGSQLPFPRLIMAMDEWAQINTKKKVIAQTGSSDYLCKHIEAHDFLSPRSFDRHMREATLIVSHAGMGNIIRARELGKPIIILPRLAALGEHRNEHQLQTAEQIGVIDGVWVASSKSELFSLLQKGLDTDFTSVQKAPSAESSLICGLAEYIDAL